MENKKLYKSSNLPFHLINYWCAKPERRYLFFFGPSIWNAKQMACKCRTVCVCSFFVVSLWKQSYRIKDCKYWIPFCFRIKIYFARYLFTIGHSDAVTVYCVMAKKPYQINIATCLCYIIHSLSIFNRIERKRKIRS